MACFLYRHVFCRLLWYAFLRGPRFIWDTPRGGWTAFALWCMPHVGEFVYGEESDQITNPKA